MRSLSGSWPWRREGEPAFAGATSAPATVLLRGERTRLQALPFGFSLDRPAPQGLGLLLAIGLLGASAAVGFVRGGQYQAFVATEGSLEDFAARELGFGVKTITMTGQSRLTPAEVLAIAGIDPKISMPFFDVDAARRRLESHPLVKQASVRKLYPGQIVIEIVERTPAALWQKNGEISTIAEDGAVIDELKDQNIAGLPFVVGAGANERLPEFQELLDSTAELKPRVAAGVLVDGRRWNLRLRNGVDIELPEADPLSAISTLLSLERDSRLLEREILSVDLRTKGKVFVRLTPDAVAARAAARPKKSGAQ